MDRVVRLFKYVSVFEQKCLPPRSALLRPAPYSTTVNPSTPDASQSVTKDAVQFEDLIITDSCVKQIKKVCDASTCLRVLVDSGGCSGFQYKFELDASVAEDDRVFERDGARLVIDSESLKLIRGSVVDYQQELIRSAFRVTSNPQAEHGCSCGASFQVKI